MKPVFLPPGELKDTISELQGENVSVFSKERVAMKLKTIKGIRFASADVQPRKIFARIFPGSDLIPAIRAICEKHEINAGAITAMLGSLSQVCFVWPIPDSEKKAGLKYGPPKTLEGPIELITGSGTIGRMVHSGELAVHLHAAFCDLTARMWGGHIVEEGNPVAVTVEIAIEVYDGLTLSRAQDDETDMPLFNLDGQPVEERKEN